MLLIGRKAGIGLNLSMALRVINQKSVPAAITLKL